MDHEVILTFLEETGYKTKMEILSKFSDQNEEIVEMQLTYLVDKNILRKVLFESNGKKELYYIAYKD